MRESGSSCIFCNSFMMSEEDLKASLSSSERSFTKFSMANSNAPFSAGTGAAGEGWFSAACAGTGRVLLILSELDAIEDLEITLLGPLGAVVPPAN